MLALSKNERRTKVRQQCIYAKWFLSEVDFNYIGNNDHKAKGKLPRGVRKQEPADFVGRGISAPPGFSSIYPVNTYSVLRLPDKLLWFIWAVRDGNGKESERTCALLFRMSAGVPRHLFLFLSYTCAQEQVDRGVGCRYQSLSLRARGEL